MVVREGEVTLKKRLSTVIGLLSLLCSLALFGAANGQSASSSSAVVNANADGAAAAPVPQALSDTQIPPVSQHQGAIDALPDSIRLFRFNAPASPNGRNPSPAERRASTGETFLPNKSDIPPNAEENLELSSVVLVVTIDGQVHALKRETGQWMWTLHDDATVLDSLPVKDSAEEAARRARVGRALGGPLVRSSSPQSRRPHAAPSSRASSNDTSLVDYTARPEEDEETFIIEPSAEGDIYVYSRTAGKLQKLPLSMQQLVAFSPFTFPSDSSRMFVGRKETKLVGVDLKTGRLVGVFGSGAGWCEWDAQREGIVRSDEECDEDISKRPEDLLYMARTEYHLSIYAKTSSTLLQTLTYTTYASSSLSSALAARWTATPDGRYLQPMHDGSLLCFVAGQSGVAWSMNFENPVISVFDIATPSGVGIEGSTEVPQPIMFQQPHPQISTGLMTSRGNLDAMPDSAFIGQYGDELFAMSKQNYPLVTFAPPREMLSPAKEEGETEDEERQGEACTGPRCIVGKHTLATSTTTGPNDQIGPADDRLAIDAAPSTTSVPVPTTQAQRTILNRALGQLTRPSSLAPSLLLTVLLVLATIIVLKRKSSLAPSKTASVPARQVSNKSKSKAKIAGQTGPEGAQAKPIEAVASAERPVEAPISKVAKQVETATATSKDLPPLPPAEPEGDDGAAGSDDDIESGDENREPDGANGSTPKRKARRRRGKKGKHKKGAVGEALTPVVLFDEARDGGDRELQALSLADVPRKDEEDVPVSAVKPSSIGSLCVSDKVLGYGSHGTVVLKGEFQGRAVAVKRLLNDFVTIATHEVNLLVESDDHPHVIRYFCNEQKDNFWYIALELCPASLYDLVEQPSAFPDLAKDFEPKRALRQITSGIRHLHKLKIVHRDIKPQNILVAPNKRSAGVRMLISDFGLCKKLDLDESSFQQTMHHAAGSFGYRAPEVLRGQVDPNAIGQTHSTLGSQQSTNDGSSSNSKSGASTDPSLRLTRSIDIFSLGCIFYYVLTKGEHPFGSRFEREMNILRSVVSLERLDGLGEEALEAQDLIRCMVAADPRDRPTASSVLVHPFFWNAQRRLLFVCDASDRFEIMERDPPDPTLVALEARAREIVGDDWQKAIDRSLLDNLGKYRKYDGSSVRDLLRVLRNKKHHYQDLPDSVRKNLGDLPAGFLSYFTTRFPHLVLHIHDIVRTHLADEAMFASTFQLPEDE